MSMLIDPRLTDKPSNFDILVDRAKVHGYRVGLSEQTENGTVVLTVRSKFVEFIRLSIKPSEINLASQIIIDTFEEQKIWQ